MPKLRPLSAKEVCSILLNHGFVKRQGKGSHMILRQELGKMDSRTVVVPNPRKSPKAL